MTMLMVVVKVFLVIRIIAMITLLSYQVLIICKDNEAITRSYYQFYY